MIGPRTESNDGSVAIGGDNTGPIFNVNAAQNSVVNLQMSQRVARELPSYLGRVIAFFSDQSLSEYSLGSRRELPPEVIQKINYNNLPEDHRVLLDYRRNTLALEKAYLGFEQRNDDARFLVRRQAAIKYNAQIDTATKVGAITGTDKIGYVRSNASALVEQVINLMLEDYKTSHNATVEQEMAHLAISLVVADALIECEVLERLPDAIAS